MRPDLQVNADRFSGFTDLYNGVRPKCPQHVVDTLLQYLGRKPELVVDMGCGTGLSTVIWSRCSDHVTGVEPNPEMLSLAGKNAENSGNVSFVNAFSDNTGIEADSADIVTCSQSFHWMEPVSTLKEVSRILKSGGIFAAYDCDWPPVFKWRQTPCSRSCSVL